MLQGWWGKFLLLILGGVFVIALFASWKGTFLPDLGKKGRAVRSGQRHIRRGSRHYYYFGRSGGYHGNRSGGGYRGGK